MHWIIAQLISWAAVRHNTCVLALHYLHRHAIGHFTCGWTHVPHTRIWVMTLNAKLGR